jgi:hypothetical protein
MEEVAGSDLGAFFKTWAYRTKSNFGSTLALLVDMDRKTNKSACHKFLGFELVVESTQDRG